MGDRPPRNLPEVYAREAIALHENPQRELKLQAIRIGELGITAMPNEVFGLSGLKIKAQSPFPTTMNIELANGSEGYIPPPEQHALGGYTTWPARTAALEGQAEPRIVATVLSLLEKVAGRPRRLAIPRPASYAEHILASRPLAYWRLEEMEGRIAHDSTGREHHGVFEREIAFYLPGANLPGFGMNQSINRAAHFAGGRIAARIAIPAESYSAEFWFWNGLPNDVRGVTGYLLEASPGADRAKGDVLGLGGSAGTTAPGRLFFTLGRPRSSCLSSKTEISPKTWHHVVLTRSGSRVAVYLDGNSEPEIVGDAGASQESTHVSFFVGSRHDDESSFEGKIDEVALYDRQLTPAEVVEHFRAARSLPEQK
jgi:hypothetical protein